jgi:hypothetical protein
MHDSRHARERVSQFWTRTQVSQKGRITQSRDGALQVRNRFDISNSGAERVTRFNQLTANVSPHKPVRTGHQYSFIHVGSSGNIFFTAADYAAID